MSVISKSQNFIDLLSSRERGARISIFADQNLFIQNIKEGNCTKTIFKGRGELIDAFDVQGDFAATVSDTIKLWNLRTGECLWTFDPSPKVYWGRTIKIIENKVICTGRVETETQCDDTIRIIDLRTGVEKFAFAHHQLEADKVCTLGRNFFCMFDHGYLGEWDIDGRLIRYKHSEKLIGRMH
ncbi:MAG: hypothetical protein K2X08_05430, partial [Chlamydiales bacterium]|nr:hypothetical protein [Chlamydiales bacterium]